MISTDYSLLAPYKQKFGTNDVWENFKNGKTVNYSLRINHIATNNTIPYKYVIPNGHCLYIHKCDRDKHYRKISGFSSTITCSDFGKADKLISVGEDKGTLRICTTDKNKYHLRKIDAHKGSISVVSFLLGGQRVASLGSDAFVNIWDIAVGEKITSYSMSTEKEIGRALITGRSDENLLCFGDFQGNVIIQDIRQPLPACKLSLANAISSLAFNFSDKKLAIASGTIVQSWDVVNRKFFYDSDELSNKLFLHYKLISSMHIVKHPNPNENLELIVSSSLDKLVKFTSLDDGKELYQIQSTYPITALGVTPNCEAVIFGGDKGFLKSRLFSLENFEGSNKEVLDDPDHETKSLLTQFSSQTHRDVFMNMNAKEWLQQPLVCSRRGPKDWFSGYKYRDFGKITLPLVHENTEISRYGRIFYANSMSDQFTRVDRLLKKFSHSRALTIALSPHFWLRKYNEKDSKKENSRTFLSITLGVIRELVRRDTLTVAVAGRSAVQLTRLFRFINKNLWKKEAATTCLQLYHCALDVYSCEELSGIKEFSKTNKLLQLLSSNIHTLRTIQNLIEHHPIISSRPNVQMQ